jgi:hypothetical protein
MHYIANDVQRLIGGVALICRYHPSSALWLLRRQVQKLEAWQEFIPLYGSVRCEPLDFLYVYLQCVAALDDLVLLDLLNEHYPRWRCILVASWLAALAPRAQYHDELVKARPFAQHPERPSAQWAVDLALAAISGEPPPELAEHHALLAKVRAVLAPLPKPVVRLRPIPSGRREEEIAELMLIQDRYRREGAEAAHATISGTLLRAVTPGLSDWKKACVHDSGDGRRLGPNREIWYWDYHL